MTAIDETGIFQALRALRAGTTTHTSLIDLHIVETIISEQGFPHSQQSREYVLNRILTQTISDSFVRQRSVLGASAPRPDESRSEALAAIRLDGQTGNLELLGWSWLYYHFVRVDLQITAAEFCAQVNISPRTLRRYQRRALKRLTMQILEAEQHVQSGLAQGQSKPTP